MTEPVFECVKSDGSGNNYTLRVMPRTEFPDLGYQLGVGIKGPLLDMIVGLGDADADAFIAALLKERGRA